MSSSSVLCLAVTLLLWQTHAFPQSSEEQDAKQAIKQLQIPSRPELNESSEEFQKEVDSVKNKRNPEDVKLDEKKTGKEQPLGANLKIMFPEDANQPTTLEEDAARLKKSPDMREVLHTHGPHTTTVCIQVRSDHQPQIMCGPQVNEEREDKPKARFAYEPAPDFYRYAQVPRAFAQGQSSLYMRASPQGPITSPASSQPMQQTMVFPAKLPEKKFQDSPSSAMGPPAAARSSPAMMFSPLARNEAEQKAIDNNQIPLGPTQQTPIRNPPVTPQVVIHRQVMPISHPYGMINPLRFNCALQPDGQYLQYGSPLGALFRGASPSYYPAEEFIGSPTSQLGQPSQLQPSQMMGPSSPRMAIGADGRAYYLDDPVRAQQEQMLGSPYYPISMADAMVGAYMDENGQYRMDESQARAAEEQSRQMWESQYLRSMDMSSSSMSMADLRSRSYEQQEELSAAKQRLQQLQEQLKDIQQRAAIDEEKKDVKKDQVKTKEQKTDAAPEKQEEKKSEPPKASKRET